MLKDIAGLVNRPSVTRLMEGVYACGHFNFELEFRRQDYKKDYPRFETGFNCYGVCDSVEQLLTHLPEEVIKGEKEYAVSVVLLEKKYEPAEGGWRWHKWGPYIGTQNPQCEYLYDEPEIEDVLVYHVYEI